MEGASPRRSEGPSAAGTGRLSPRDPGAGPGRTAPPTPRPLSALRGSLVRAWREPRRPGLRSRPRGRNKPTTSTQRVLTVVRAQGVPGVRRRGPFLGGRRCRKDPGLSPGRAHELAGCGVAIPGGRGGLPGRVGTQCGDQTLPVRAAGHLGAELVGLEPAERAQRAVPGEIGPGRGGIGQGGRPGHEGQHAVGRGVLTLQGPGDKQQVSAHRRAGPEVAPGLDLRALNSTWHPERAPQTGATA